MLLKKTGWIWPALLLLIVLAVLMSLAIGRYPLSLASVLKVIFNPMEDDIANNIVLSVRLPRVLLALMVGAGLAISGACFQGVFQNPLVSPDSLMAAMATA